MTDSSMLVLVSACSFSAGVTVGWLLRAVWQTRKKVAVTTDTKTTGKKAPLPRAYRVGLVLLGLVLVMNAAVGFLQIQNTLQDRERVDCGVRFNEQLALALNERSSRATEQTAAEVQLWRGLSDALDDTAPDPRDPVGAEISTYVQTLQAAQRSRVENPYPPADLCR